MKTIRWGIIGCGDVTEVKSGPALMKAENSSLVAVMRRNEALAEDYARRHGALRWSGEAEDILQAPDIDAIYIATPPSSHREYVCRAAEHGKAVLVEKPMGVTHGECNEMIATCQREGVSLWVAYYRRCLPRYIAARNMIASGAIGEVQGVTVLKCQQPSRWSGNGSWRFDAANFAHGVFIDTVCHLFDLLDWLFGPITEIHGQTVETVEQATGRVPGDTVAASFRFESGIVGSGFWSLSANRSVDRVTVFGSNGSLSFPAHVLGPISIDHGAEPQLVDIPDPPHVHQPLIQSIVDELNGLGPSPSSGVSGARTARVMDRIFKRDAAVTSGETS